MGRKYPPVEIGHRYGDWAVIDGPIIRPRPSGQNSKLWRCRCKCGEERSVDDCNLKTGKSRGCGCASASTLPIGVRVGKWTVLADGGTKIVGRKRPELVHVYICRCECGEERPVNASKLVHKRSLSCGSCHLTAPDGSRPPPPTPDQLALRQEWRKQLATKCAEYGLNIRTVFSRIRRGWSESQALEIEPPPLCGPSGRRTGILVATSKGLCRYSTLGEAAAAFTLSETRVRNRLSRQWTLEQALGLEARPPKKLANAKAIAFTYDGKQYTYPSYAAAATAHGLNVSTLHERVTELGWSMAQALNIAPPPPRKASGAAKPVFFIFDGEEYRYPSVVAAAKSRGLTAAAVRNRLYRSKWTWPQALGLEAPPHHRGKCFGIAYLVTHVSSGRQYVGQTRTSLKKRWDTHVLNAFRKPPTNEYGLAAALREYGPEAFAVEQIDTAHSKHELNQLERRLIVSLGTRAPAGFNIARGGGGFIRGERVSVDGKEYSSRAEAARTLGVNPGTVHSRLSAGWTVEQAFEIEPPPNGPYGRNISVRVEGETLTFPSILSAVRHFGIQAADARIRVLGWTPEQAFEIDPPPPQPRNGNAKAVSFVHEGRRIEYESIAAAASVHKLDASTVRYRIKHGWPWAQALELETISYHRTKGASHKPITVQTPHGPETFVSIPALAESRGIKPGTLRARLYRSKKSVEDAIVMGPGKSTNESQR
jgi:hypothetical protein